MAEVIGVIASVAQLVQISGALLAGGYGFLSTVSRAPSEIRSLLTETAAVNSLLGQLQVIADSKAANDDALQSLERLGVLQECQAILGFVQKALARCQQEAGKDFQNFGKRLKWPFKEKETKDALQRLHQLRGVLANAVEVDSANTLRRIENSQGMIVEGLRVLTTTANTQMSREETQKILSWLCPLPTTGAQVSLDNAIARHLHGTGVWFLNSKLFQSWISPKENPHLSSIWITGLPGSGKTLLCASTIKKLLTVKAMNKSLGGMAILYFFCDHRDPAKVSHDSFVMTLTCQMLDLSPEFAEQAKRMYDEKAKNGDRIFNPADYISLLQSSMSLCKSVYIFCDALDESTEGDEIASSLEKLLTYGQKHGIPTRILITSRFDVQLERRHASITSNRVALAENMKPDVEHYVNMEVESRVAKGTLKLRDKTLKAPIRHEVASRAGTMLHARLQLDYLATAKNDRDLKAMINSLPDGLEHTYQTLLSNMAALNPERIAEMKLLLRCLVIASPTLTAANLAEVLAMQPGKRHLDFDTVATDPYDALEIIAPLVILTNSRRNHGIVKLSHFSLDEFLLSPRILQGPASQFHVSYEEGNAWLASICLQYLTFDVFNASKHNISLWYSPPLEEYSFRRYAALNWFRHFAVGKNVPGFKEQCQPYLDRLFDDEDGSPCYKGWQEVFRQGYPYHEYHRYSPICFAISQGFDELVDDLLPQLMDIDQQFPDNYTCLTMAAKWNRSAIVRKLLDRGANIEIPGPKLCTPLHLAAEFGSQEAFDVLLDAGANPHARSSSGSSPFYRACRGGNVHIVKRLKECHCDFNVYTHDGWTPIMEAVENGHEPIVDLLIEWGADMSMRTDQGWTVLLIAEDGFNLAPNRSVIEKLKKAAPEKVYEEFLEDQRIASLEDDE